MTQEDIKKIRKNFPWFNNNPKLCYLDNSATSLKPKCVIDAIVEYYEKFSCNPHNTDSLFTYSLHTKINKSRQLVADLLNVSPEEIIFTSGATESLNLIANGIKNNINRDDEIIITYTEHTSNILPWQELCKEKQSKIVFAGESFIPTEQDIINKITPKTKIISFCNVSNILGYDLNYTFIAKKAKEINPKILIIVDATQAIPHQKHDLKNSGVDCLVFSGHKMLGPTGIGVCYINKHLIESVQPIRLGGGMNANVNTKYYTCALSPDKFEGGTPNVAGIIGLGAAIEYLNSISWDNIEKYESELKKYFDSKCTDIPNFEYYSSQSKHPIIFFNIKGCSSQDLANYLGNNNIIVRSGLSCAKLSKLETKIESAVRASFYFYNTFEEVDQLINKLKEYKKGSELDYVINR